jgi:tRNA nucleotidyltransferase (CCA-adding enzyme)
MQVYLVGGAVRDRLLDYPVRERDWVVVGATAAELLAQGYQQVGKDFPVFLHPNTKEEYALARTERKSGPGYTGFTCNSDPGVTLEEDLLRRDLTINAIAEDADGKLVDPYGGQRDLAAKQLRHVSAAFAEDPLRVLRVARFAARYAHLGFSVAPETLELMRSIVISGELATLPHERLWTEMSKALTETSPDVFFLTLRACDGLTALLPELEPLEQPLQRLAAASKHFADSAPRFAALLCELLPAAVDALCTRLRPPNQHRELASLCARFASALDAPQAASTALQLLDATDAWRRAERFDTFLQVCEAVNPNRQEWATPLRTGVQACSSIDTAPWIAAGIKGREIGERINAARLDALETVYGKQPGSSP